jgi:hypothetical protein
VIAWLENDLPLDSLAVYERPVCAPQVAEPDCKVIDGENAVMATDQIAVRAQVAVLFAPDEKLPDMKRNRFSLLPSFQYFQLDLKHGVGAPTGNFCADTEAASRATDRPAQHVRTRRRSGADAASTGTL